MIIEHKTVQTVPVIEQEMQTLPGDYAAQADEKVFDIQMSYNGTCDYKNIQLVSK